IKESMNKLLSLFYLVFVFTTLSAQKQSVIEPAILECQYRHTMVLDTTINNPSKLEDLMILRMGENTSQFFSRYSYYADSLLNDPQGSKLFSQLTLEAVRTRDHSNRPGARTTHDYIYKRYPEGKITTTSTLHINHLIIFEEIYEPQNWIVTDSVKTIMNYDCQLAECNFRGRKYYAWYTPDIAISDGPWKFNGLPGLIMELYDKDKHYYYEIVGIYNTDIPPVTFYNPYNEQFEKMNRIDFLRAQRKSQENHFQQVKATLGIDLDSQDKAKTEIKRDFLEKDYHKK
ncbi:MAG: GLPGLI family protein, partial [Bacteroides sp.]|nr:GLPGLI family protein [Bacteroides sp.]